MDRQCFEEAVIEFRKSAEITPHFKTFELLGECELRLGRFSSATEPLKKAVQMNSGVRAASLLADSYLAIGEYDLANLAVKVALKRDPTNRTALRVQKALEELMNS